MFRVPFLVYAPQTLPSTVIIDGSTSHIDVAPTLLALLGETGGLAEMQGVPVWQRSARQRIHPSAVRLRRRRWLRGRRAVPHAAGPVGRDVRQRRALVRRPRSGRRRRSRCRVRGGRAEAARRDAAGNRRPDSRDHPRSNSDPGSRQTRYSAVVSWWLLCAHERSGVERGDVHGGEFEGTVGEVLGRIVQQGETGNDASAEHRDAGRNRAWRPSFATTYQDNGRSYQRISSIIGSGWQLSCQRKMIEKRPSGPGGSALGQTIYLCGRGFRNLPAIVVAIHARVLVTSADVVWHSGQRT